MSNELGFESGILQRSSRGVSMRLTLGSGDKAPWINGGHFDPIEKRAEIESEEVSAAFQLVTPVGQAPRRLLMKGTINGEPWVGFETDYPHIVSLKPDTALASEPVAWV